MIEFVNLEEALLLINEESYIDDEMQILRKSNNSANNYIHLIHHSMQKYCSNVKKEK